MSLAPQVVRQAKRVWREVNGVLLLDKPGGVSSNHALQSARRLFSAAKAGHTGTLDPMATGLLPLCFGEATKFTGELLHADKRYRARVRLGVRTDTADAEGTVLSESPVMVTGDQVVALLPSFMGTITQIPPMYSALKRDGKPLYEYARAGIELERSPRQVNIYELTLLSWGAPYFEFDVLCSKGTYVRTLAADIGERLGCGAHLVALQRTEIGRLSLDTAVTLASLESISERDRERYLAAPDSLLSHLPSASLNEMQTERMTHGQAVAWEGDPDTRWRIYASNQCFLGVGRTRADGKLYSDRLVATAKHVQKKTISG